LCCGLESSAGQGNEQERQECQEKSAFHLNSLFA
jgi:hypothetical protein